MFKEKFAEYYQNHKEHLKQKAREYQLENKEVIKVKDAEYYRANKEAIKIRSAQPYTCECGSTMTIGVKARHEMSRKHLLWFIKQ